MVAGVVRPPRYLECSHRELDALAKAYQRRQEEERHQRALLFGMVCAELYNSNPWLSKGDRGKRPRDFVRRRPTGSQKSNPKALYAALSDWAARHNRDLN